MASCVSPWKATHAVIDCILSFTITPESISEKTQSDVVAIECLQLHDKI